MSEVALPILRQEIDLTFGSVSNLRQSYAKVTEKLEKIDALRSRIIDLAVKPNEVKNSFNLKRTFAALSGLTLIASSVGVPLALGKSAFEFALFGIFGGLYAVLSGTAITAGLIYLAVGTGVVALPILLGAGGVGLIFESCCKKPDTIQGLAEQMKQIGNEELLREKKEKWEYSYGRFLK